MSFLSKIGKGIGKAGKFAGKAIGGGLKAVASTGLVPGIGGKALGVVGNLLAPKKTASNVSPLIPNSGVLSKVVKTVETAAPLIQSMKPALPTFAAPLTGVQRTVFGAAPVIDRPVYATGNIVAGDKGFDFGLGNMGTGSGDVDKKKTNASMVPILVSVGGIIVTLLIFLFGKRKR
jgi:hypothetical protein